MHQSAVSVLINSKRKMSLDEAARFASILRLSLEDVAVHAGAGALAAQFGAGELSRGKAGQAVGVIGWVDTDSEVWFGEAAGPKVVQAPAGGRWTSEAPLKAIRVQVQGPWEGWVLYFREAEGMSADVVGRLCVVRTEDHATAMLGWVKRGWELGAWMLAPFTGGQEVPLGPVLSAAPILWAKQ